MKEVYKDEQIAEMAEVNDLKKIEADIDILACNAGHLDHYDDNLANAFDDITTGKVYASDGNVSFYPSIHAIEKLLKKLPKIKTDDEEFNNYQDKAFDEYPEELYYPRLSFNQGGFKNAITANNTRLPKGFYYLDDGDKVYVNEKYNN